jgi:hypothetical protein
VLLNLPALLAVVLQKGLLLLLKPPETVLYALVHASLKQIVRH